MPAPDSGIEEAGKSRAGIEQLRKIRQAKTHLMTGFRNSEFHLCLAENEGEPIRKSLVEVVATIADLWASSTSGQKLA